MWCKSHLLSRSKPRSDSSEPNRLRSWLYGYSVNVHFFIAGSSLTPGQIFSVGVPNSYTSRHINHLGPARSSLSAFPTPTKANTSITSACQAPIRLLWAFHTWHQVCQFSSYIPHEEPSEIISTGFYRLGVIVIKPTILSGIPSINLAWLFPQTKFSHWQLPNSPTLSGFLDKCSPCIIPVCLHQEEAESDHTTLKMRLSSSISDLPGKSGFFMRNSAKMQPTDHMSMGVLYSLAPSSSSGARYHSVTTIGV